MLRPLPIVFVGLQFGRLVLDRLFACTAAQRYRLVGVCDLDASKATATAASLGVRTYPSLEAVLADDEVRVIGLFSGPAGRAALIRQIIRAGKDVMTTKPFETDAVAARAVLSEAQAAGRTIFLNSPEPELPGYLQQVQAWRDEYKLGRPITCRAESFVPYREQADGRWLDDPELCPVAPIFRVGIYLIHDLVRVFGRIEAVQVMANRIFTGRPTPDNAQLSVRFENGALGTIAANFCVDNGQHYANALWLHFEHGTIYRNATPVPYGESEHSSRLQLAATSLCEVRVREWQAAESSGQYPWDALADVLTGRRSVPMPLDVLVHGIDVIAAMARAERSGRTEQVSIPSGF